MNSANEWRSDHPLTFTVRAVCRGCNRGWMSDIESEAMPFLLPMMLDHRTRLEADAQVAVARWAVLKTMVGEMVTVSRAVPASAHSAFYDTRSMLGLRVFIGRYADETTDFARNAFFDHVVFGPQVPEDYTGNPHCTTISVGALIVQVTGFAFARKQHAEKERAKFGSSFRTVWPVRRERVVWPPLFSVSESELLRVTVDRIVGGTAP